MHQDWLWGLAGGALIGTAGAMFLLINGRVMGASSVIGDVIDGSARTDRRENIAFLAGLFALPALISWLWLDAATHLTPQIWVIVGGGLLVGFGARMANGCTSGHGVCGISRLSPRGIAATIAYVGTGAATIALLRHVWGVI